VKRLPWVLVLITLVHGLVDGFGAFVQPLWPDLKRTLHADDGSIQWAYLLWGLATSVTQLVFGYLGDRHPRGWLIWVGPAVGLVCLSLVGLAPNLVSLSVLLCMGGLGIAAFHPEAAAMAGSSAPEDRSRAMSIFSVGGYLGQAAGPIYSGVISTQFGLKALVWSLVWGLPVLALLALGLRQPTQRTRPDRGGAPTGIPIGQLVHGRLVALSMILLIGTLRVYPTLGIPLALSYMLKLRGFSNDNIGIIQSAFLGGVGVGSLACALFVKVARERRVMWQVPLLVSPLILSIPWIHPTALFPTSLASGLLLGITLPILVSLGQRLMPDGQRIASSITMGVTWGFGGILIAVTMAIVNRMGAPGWAFPAFALACVASSLLCAWLPTAHQDVSVPLTAKDASPAPSVP